MSTDFMFSISQQRVPRTRDHCTPLCISYNVDVCTAPSALGQESGALSALQRQVGAPGESAALPGDLGRSRVLVGNKLQEVCPSVTVGHR